MKNKILTIIMLILFSVPTFAAEMVNFKIDNRRCEGNDYLVDLTATVEASSTWTVGVLTLVLEYNGDAINAASYDVEYLSDIAPEFSGTDYGIYQTEYTDNQIAISIYTGNPSVDLGAGEHKIGTFKFEIVDTTEYDDFAWVVSECNVYNHVNEMFKGTNPGDFNLTAPWSRRIKPLIGKPTLSSPSDAAVDVAFDIDFDWSDVATATGYKIRVGTDQSFSAGTVEIDTETASSDYTGTAAMLDYGETYYWQAAALNSTDTSFWSETFSFTTEANLATPSLLTPLNGATDVPIATMLDWDNVTGADSYYLQVSEDAGFSTLHIDDNTLTASEFDCSTNNLKYGEQYYWKVRAENSGGKKSSWSSTFIFETVELLSPTLVSPADNAADQDVTGVQLTWNTADYAAEYRLQVSTGNTFAPGDIVIDQTVSDTNETITGLNLGDTYYWRVISVAASGQESDHGAAGIRAFTVETIAAPNLTLPADVACDVDVETAFSWSTVSNADEYELIVSENPSFSTTVYTATISSTSQTVPAGSALDPGTGYYWKVRGLIGSTYKGDWSTARSFETEHFTTLVSPADQATGVESKNTVFKWNATPEATKYNIVIADDAAFGAGDILKDEEVTGTTYTPDYLYSETDYFWKVRVKGCGDYGDWSGVRKLTVQDFGPPVLSSPSNSASDVSNSPKLQWTSVSETDYYEIEISKNSSFTFVIWSDTSHSGSITASGLDYHTNYFWRVRPVNSKESGAWASYFSFLTENAPCEWSPITTTLIHNVNVPASIAPTINGRAIADDDYIGIFYDSTGTGDYVCAGMAEWTGSDLIIKAYGDDPVTAEKDGFADNEDFNFYFWDSREGKEVEATARFSFGTEYFKNGSTSEIDTLYAGNANYQKVQLANRWNMISTYLELNETELDSIFENTSNLFLMKNTNGAVYLPAYDIDGINDWEYKEGYLLYMLGADSVMFEGDAVVPESTDIYLKSRWNIVANFNNKSAALATAWATVYSNLFLAKNENGAVTLPAYGIDQIGTLQPGRGYLLYMLDKDTLTYPANSTLKPVKKKPAPAPKYLTVEPNGMNSSHFILETDFEDGIEIGAYNQTGRLVGSGVVNDGQAVVAVFGIDEFNSEYIGANEGEELRFMAYSPESRKMGDLNLTKIEILLGETADNNPVFRTNTLTSAKATYRVASDSKPKILSISPNPATEEFFAEITLGENESMTGASIKLFDNTGRELSTIFEGDISAETPEIKVNCRSLSSGVYTVVLSYDGKQIIERIVIGK